MVQHLLEPGPSLMASAVRCTASPFLFQRAGIQTSSFYTCDYSTKSSRTCGPVLKHLTLGMQRLEHQLQEEKAESETLLQSFPLPHTWSGGGRGSDQDRHKVDTPSSRTPVDGYVVCGRRPTMR